jgi:hypothetical protein
MSNSEIRIHGILSDAGFYSLHPRSSSSIPLIHYAHIPMNNQRIIVPGRVIADPDRSAMHINERRDTGQVPQRQRDASLGT